jgi:hypothetical protein
MRPIDFAKVKELAERYKPDMTRFLRDMIGCQRAAGKRVVGASNRRWRRWGSIQ